MDISATALLLLGFQNDFFSAEGAMRDQVREPSQLERVKKNTIDLIHMVYELPLPVLYSPLSFSKSQRDLSNKAGFYQTLREHRAFLKDTPGEEAISDLIEFGQRITDAGSRHGLNAMQGTRVHQILSDRSINHIAIAGLLDALCIDSTARAAVELGYQVTIISDCTTSRSVFEHKYYSENIFPLYADVMTSIAFVQSLQKAA